MRKPTRIYARIWKRQLGFIKNTIQAEGEETILLSKGPFIKAGKRETFFKFRFVMKNGKIDGYDKNRKVMKDLELVLCEDPEIFGLMKRRRIVFKLTDDFKFTVYCVKKIKRVELL